LFFVDLLKLLVGHENFAADFEDAGDFLVVTQSQRDRFDRPDVGGDVVAARAIASRGREG
jgi:hypothetical protein